MDPAPVRDLAKPVPVAAKLAMPAQGLFRRSGSSWVSCPLHQKAYPSSWVGVQVWVRVLARAEPAKPAAVVLAEPAVLVLAELAKPAAVVLAKPAVEPLVQGPPVAQVLFCEALCPSPPEVCPSFLARLESRQCPFSFINKKINQ